MSASAHKVRLRTQFKRKRERHLDEAAQLSAGLCHILESLEHHVVAVYSALSGEADLSSIVDTWLAEGRIVLYPRVIGKGTMGFVRVRSRSELSPAAFGILEPTGEVWTGSVDAVLVPGLAFDLLGNRLGFGGGYYDRFLQPPRPSRVIGVGFDWQMVRRLPAEPHDVLMDAVVTDRRWYG